MYLHCNNDIIWGHIFTSELSILFDYFIFLIFVLVILLTRVYFVIQMFDNYIM